MVGDSNEFVAARDGRLRHRANIAGAVAPICVHLQIAPKARPPQRHFGQPTATFGESKKFFPQRRRTRRALLLSNPLPDLLLKKRPDVCQLYQRALLRNQIARLNFPEEGAARSPPIGALQNLGSFARFARKELRDFGIARRKIDARLQFNEPAKVVRWHPPRPYFRRLALRFCFFTNCSARFGPDRPSGRNCLPRSWL